MEAVHDEFQKILTSPRKLDEPMRTATDHSITLKTLEEENKILKQELQNDKAKLTIKAAITVHSVSMNKANAFLVVEAVNEGMRPIRIDGLDILISKDAMLMPIGTPKEVRDKMLKDITGTRHVKEENYEIKSDGDKKTWEIFIRHSSELDSHNDENGCKCGKGYITLTSGEKVWFDFIIPDLSTLVNNPWLVRLPRG
jgi:hypothetical protein